VLNSIFILLLRYRRIVLAGYDRQVSQRHRDYASSVQPPGFSHLDTGG
jgi:hypothetical protein